MRKNIYNGKILMIKVKELNLLYSYNNGKNCTKEVRYTLKEYLSIDKIEKCIKASYTGEKSALSMDDEIGISLSDERNVKIKEEFEKFTEVYAVSLEKIHNAFLWAIFSNADNKIRDILQSILIGRRCLGEKEFRDEYGSDLLEYIFLYGNYDYSSGVNPVLETDKKIQLIDNGELKEIELSLNNDNSFELGRLLREKIKGKIDFEKNYVVENGKYRGTS